jgi:two-component system, OmpR family, response regulator
MSEVLATIRAALRRRAGLAAPITANDVISLDPATREASCCDLHARLTGQEFSLLQAPMVRSDAILPRQGQRGQHIAR